MIYVNSETILKIDRFSLLRYERVIHIWDILFLTITYFISAYSYTGSRRKWNGAESNRTRTYPSHSSSSSYP